MLKGKILTSRALAMEVTAQLVSAFPTLLLNMVTVLPRPDVRVSTRVVAPPLVLSPLLRATKQIPTPQKWLLPLPKNNLDKWVCPTLAIANLLDMKGWTLLTTWVLVLANDRVLIKQGLAIPPRVLPLTTPLKEIPYLN